MKRFTHFIGIPLNGLSKAFHDSLKHEINPDCVVPPSRYHLTLNCLKLQYHEFETIKEIIRECVMYIEPFHTHINSINTFHKQDMTNVVFARILEQEMILTICERINIRLYEKGFIKKKDLILPKLHMTVINVKYGDGQMISMRSIEKYKKFDFGIAQIDEISLFQMKKAIIDGESRYLKEFTVKF
eukprot:NODE_616_length_5370_cov_0.348131.p5 type:complete len:186 gc:universal NODE_616_length_5370_cov_0.348131:2350-2907(+)